MKKTLLCFVYLANLSLHAQVNVFDDISANVKFENQRTYTLQQGKKYNPEEFYAHPDFGKLTFDAPFGKNVAEDISKRTSDSRYYVDLDNPTHFYIQKSSKAINHYVDGYWRAIDPTLHQINTGVYESGMQPCRTKLDLLNKKTGIYLGNEVVEFNNYSLKVIDNNNVTTIHQSNWSQIAVANNGAYITEVFPGIDMRLQYFEGSIKSEFIIKQNLHVKKLIFADELQIPSYLNAFLQNDTNTNFETVVFENTETGVADLTIKPAKSFDASGNGKFWISPFNLIGNKLEIICDSIFLNNENLVYPLTIDPTTTVVGPIGSAFGVMGSLLSPAFCSSSLTVTFPGGTTPWDASIFWNIYTDYCYGYYTGQGLFFDECYRSQAQTWITSSCGGVSPVGAPGTIWTCTPNCNSSGVWSPTIGFASSGTQSLAQCYTPSCSNQNLTFTINLNRSICPSYSPYDICNWGNSACVSLDEWSVTVQGRSAETLANTITGNGTQTIAAVSCASGTQTLNPGALYGVPGYTYSWNTGATTSTINVPNGPSTYTATVTDACGTSRLATFTITCPLSIELVNFTAEEKAHEVVLNWSTLTEKNHAYFDVLRAGSDLQFKAIGRIAGHGTSSDKQDYRFVDMDPIAGISYYQLASVSTSEETQLSDIRTVQRKAAFVKSLSVIPNPNNGTFSLAVKIPESGTYFVELIGTDGRVYYQTENQLELGERIIPITGVQLHKGTYLVRVRSGNTEFQEKMLVE